MSYAALFEQFRSAGFTEWADYLTAQAQGWLVHHGDYARWSNALNQLPTIEGIEAHFDRSAITIEGSCDQKEQLLDSHIILARSF